MFPLYDDNPHFGRPFVTWAIMAGCILAFLWQISLGAQGARAVYSLGVIPSVLFGIRDLPAGLSAVPAWGTLFTSMFLHGGFMHLAGNMLYLWIFGDNVEIVMGRARFAVFYALCGVAAALSQSLMVPDSDIPMIGASGAISGLLGAYLLLFPRANVVVFIFLIGAITVPAILVLGFWFLMQIFSGVSTPVGGGGVAFWAHIGGFVAGMALIPFFKKPGVRLMQRKHSPSFRLERRRKWGKRRGPWG